MIGGRRSKRSAASPRHRLALALAAIATCALIGIWPVPAAAQTSDSVAVVVRDLGPGMPGRLLREVLAGPHTSFAFRDSGPPVALRRDSTFATTVLVVGRGATVASTVHGDVVVVGGDLFLHPGASVDGRAVAIGGGVYNSTLATVRGARLAFRDETFVTLPDAPGVARATVGARDTLVLAYRSLGVGPPPVVSFPLYGFRLPAYDRVNGLSVLFGPVVSLDTGRITIDPVVTYRSDLGEVDPSIATTVGVRRRTTLSAFAGRATRTNDEWKRNALLNAISVIAAGIDTRNYYRADVAEARLARRWEGTTSELSPFVGASVERAWSVGPDTGAESAPYSIFLRRDRERGMLRPNPRVERGRIASALVGGTGRWTGQDIASSLDARVEVPFQTVGGRRFTQATLDGAIGFPTFGTQRLDLDGHAVVTVGDTAPPQRFAYLGGEDGTIVTEDLLSLGGDQLLYVQGLYSVPVERVTIRFLGSPIVALRYAAGAAGVGDLPAIVQNVGVRVSLSLVRFQYMLEPASRRSRTSVALSIFR